MTREKFTQSFSLDLANYEWIRSIPNMSYYMNTVLTMLRTHFTHPSLDFQIVPLTTFQTPMKISARIERVIASWLKCVNSDTENPYTYQEVAARTQVSLITVCEVARNLVTKGLSLPMLYNLPLTAERSPKEKAFLSAAGFSYKVGVNDMLSEHDKGWNDALKKVWEEVCTVRTASTNYIWDLIRRDNALDAISLLEKKGSFDGKCPKCGTVMEYVRFRPEMRCPKCGHKRKCFY